MWVVLLPLALALPLAQNTSKGLYLWCGKKWHAAHNTSKVARSNVGNFGECKSCKAEQS